MFSVAAKILTVIGVLFHAAVGCCAHHHHEAAGNWSNCESQPLILPNAEARTCPCHPVSVKPALADPVDNDHRTEESCPPGESHGGCSDHCSWITSSRVELAARAGGILADLTTDGWVCSTGSRNSVDGQIQSGQLPLRFGDPDALRASIQIWRL